MSPNRAHQVCEILITLRPAIWFAFFVTVQYLLYQAVQAFPVDQSYLDTKVYYNIFFIYRHIPFLRMTKLDFGGHFFSNKKNNESQNQL